MSKLTSVRGIYRKLKVPRMFENLPSSREVGTHMFTCHSCILSILFIIHVCIIICLGETALQTINASK